MLVPFSLWFSLYVCDIAAFHMKCVWLHIWLCAIYSIRNSVGMVLDVVMCDILYYVINKTWMLSNMVCVFIHFLINLILTTFSCTTKCICLFCLSYQFPCLSVCVCVCVCVLYCACVYTSFVT